jgi:hypothetical protein
MRFASRPIRASASEVLVECFCRVHVVTFHLRPRSLASHQGCRRVGCRYWTAPTALLSLLRGFEASRLQGLPPITAANGGLERNKKVASSPTVCVCVCLCVPLGSRDRETMQIMQCTIQSVVLSARLRDYLP